MEARSSPVNIVVSTVLDAVYIVPLLTEYQSHGRDVNVGPVVEGQRTYDIKADMFARFFMGFHRILLPWSVLRLYPRILDPVDFRS